MEGGKSELIYIYSTLLKHFLLVTFALALLTPASLFANITGGGTNGTAVTLTDNGDGTVTMANGIVSIHINKTGGAVDQINYTFNNSGVTQTLNVLSDGHNGGQLYWENSGNQGLSFTYAVVANPASTGGNYAEVVLSCTTVANILFEVHYSMLRGNTGFYATPIWIHRSTDGAFSMGECRDNIYSGAIFNWMSVDEQRNKLMPVNPSYTAVGVQGAPVECSLWTSGIYAGQYEDKYKFAADYGKLRAWGWSSVGTGGKNIGLWDVPASFEYMASGPMRTELTSHMGTTILNTPHGAHYGFCSDSTNAVGEVWAKVCGPHFIYCNAITNTLTGTNAAAQQLFADALAQADAETAAWPYYWFTNVNYAPPAARGTISGKMVINDIYNPGASASNLWVGVQQQPDPSSTMTYDFQKWYKTYQFWVKTDANGNFTIPDVIATTNYTLYAFGPGAAGTFQSQPQTGGSAPHELNIPSPQFSINVTAGATNNLGIVTWTPNRVGPTVFEIGFPNRTGDKFRHGDDWWVGDIGPGPTNPMPVWSKFLEYPFDFPTGVNYTVGSSRWTTDWNYCQPVVVDAAGNYNGSTSTINFNLPSAPGATASLYIGLSSDFQGPLIVSVNGNNISGSTGYFPSYSGSGDGSDATIREGIHGLFSDKRLTFSGSLLHTGANTITINMRKGGYFANHAMYDYIRLEMPGYIPPAPGSLNAYAGNNRVLLSWPAQPGATSYNILRSTTSGSGYVSLTNGVIGPVCGSGWNNATYVDANAVNGTTYYYVIQSANPVGTSTNSPEAPATPSSAISTTSPAPPATASIGAVAHQSVTVNWSASANANFYTLYRSTLYNNGGGASNILGTIVLNNTITGTSFTDTAVTDGSIYRYFVTATSAAGTSTNSNGANAIPLPAPPASAPANLVGKFVQTTNLLLTWSPVPGAVGYIIRSATSSGGPFNYVENVTQTNFTDYGLNPATYYYTVTAVNAAGVSTNKQVTVIAPPAAPVSLTALAGNTQIILTWSSVANANGYYLYRGTSSSNENVTVLANYPGTSYTDTNLANGTTYYYYVTATNTGGVSPNSAEASATPSLVIVAGGRSLTWKGDGAANLWNVSGAANWRSNTTVLSFLDGDNVTFDNTGSNNVPVTISGIPQPSVVTFNATKNYTLAGGSLTGACVFVKANTGTLTVTSSNYYSGGTFLSNGIIALSGPAPGSVTANNFALGSGPITFDAGVLQLYGYNLKDDSNSLGYGAFTNDVIVFAGQTATFYGGPRYTFGSKVTGSGTLNFFVDYVRGDIGGNWSGFAGNVFIRSTTGTPNAGSVDDFRISSTVGGPNARVSLATNIFMYSRATAGATIPIGEFSAAPGSFVSAGGGSSAGTQFAVTWRVGGLNSDATNAAIFQGTTALIKEGTGNWTLTGASTHSGATIVNDGTLTINGSFNGSPVTLNGGTLAGTGSISGASVILNSDSTLAPGNPFGTLTVSNNLTLAAASTTTMQVQHSPLASDTLKVTGTFAANGVLNIVDTGSGSLTNGDSFVLFNTPTKTGNFTSIVLPDIADDLVWNTNALPAGRISVVALTPPTFSGAQVAGNSVIINGTGGADSWPYIVLTATNLTSPVWLPVATNRCDVTGNILFTNVLTATPPQKFFRIQLQ